MEVRDQISSQLAMLETMADAIKIEVNGLRKQLGYINAGAPSKGGKKIPGLVKEQIKGDLKKSMTNQ